MPSADGQGWERLGELLREFAGQDLAAQSSALAEDIFCHAAFFVFLAAAAWTFVIAVKFGSYNNRLVLAIINAFDDHLEPVEAVTVSAAEKTRLIQLAALNYWMQKEPRPMRAVAAEIGCTPAAISRTLNIISNKLGAKAPCQKSAAARAAYADRQRRLAAEGRGGKNKKRSLTLMA